MTLLSLLARAPAPMGRMGLERRVASSASAGDEGAEKKVIGDEIEDSGVRFDARRQVKLGVCHDVQLDSLNTTN